MHFIVCGIKCMYSALHIYNTTYKFWCLIWRSFAKFTKINYITGNSEAIYFMPKELKTIAFFIVNLTIFVIFDFA